MTGRRTVRLLALGAAVSLLAIGGSPRVLLAQRAQPSPLDSARAAIPGKNKSPAAAAVLGFAPGVGHLYAGEINRGWLIIALYATGYALNHDGRTDTRGKIGGVLLVGGVLAGVVDGASAARRYNARMAKLRAAARDSSATEIPARAPANPSDTTSARRSLPEPSPRPLVGKEAADSPRLRRIGAVAHDHDRLVRRNREQ